MKLFRFLLIATLCFSFVYISSARVVSAQVVDDLIQYQEAVNQGEESANYEAFSSETLYNIGNGLLGWMAGCSAAVENCPERLRADGGAMGSVSKMIAFTYENKAADTQTYIADVMQNAGIVEPAYAQGLGFSSLRPILELWKVFRNIAYVFFVFLFLIIGFAIMFRKNLGGQTAVTVQQALPRIIVALLAVSFSYAIAGFLIDMMYVLMVFLIVIFQQSNLINADVADLGNQGERFILNQNIFQVFGEIITFNFVTDAGSIVGGAVQNMLNGNNVIASGLGWISGVLAALIIFFALVFALFRTFFSLIKVYLEIILSIIFAPLILMLGAINSNAFGNWFKGLAANLAVFPVLLVFILIGQMFVNTNQPLSQNGVLSSQFDESGFVPPFVPGRGNAQNIGLVVGIAAVMLLPEVVGMMAKYKPQSVFGDLSQTAWKNAMAGRNPGLATGGLLGGVALGSAGGLVAGSVAALRANPGDRYAAFRKRATQGAVIGAGGGSLLGGARYLNKGVGMVGNLSRNAKEVNELVTARRQAVAQRAQQKASGNALPSAGIGENTNNLLDSDLLSERITRNQADQAPTRQVGVNPEDE